MSGVVPWSPKRQMQTEKCSQKIFPRKVSWRVLGHVACTEMVPEKVLGKGSRKGDQPSFTNQSINNGHNNKPMIIINQKKTNESMNHLVKNSSFTTAYF